MSLSNELVSLFVKATKDTAKTSKESTVYGTVVQYGDSKYVQIDGSDQLTPCASVADVAVGERVSVQIKNHTATITGNLSSPSAKNSTVREVEEAVSGNIAYKITATDIEAVTATINRLEAILIKCEELTADEINAILAQIETLKATFIEGEYVTTNELNAITAQIESLEATFGSFTDLSADHLEAATAEINQLKVYSGDFTYLVAEEFKAVNAAIKKLDVEKLSAESADIKYANIDFSNIGEAAVRKIFSDSGLIKDLVVGDGVVTGELVGVTIKGDLIEGGTVKADKLVVKGEDGLYYKLNIEAGATTSAEVTKEELQNGLHGTAIIAKTITAEKIAVDDLVAFDATIGGFNITDNSLYSGVKESVDNTTRGVYLDSEGQTNIGDASNFIKYYKDRNGVYRLEISAGSILLGANQKSVEEAIEEAGNIDIGGRNLIRNSTTMMFDDYYFDDIGVTLVSSDDGDGGVTIESNDLLASDDGAGNVIFTTTSIVGTDDDAGNLELSIN